MTFEFNLKGGAIAAMAIAALVSALLVPLPASPKLHGKKHDVVQCYGMDAV
jgi:hypothetical protein